MGRATERMMSKWIPLLVRIEDYAELAAQVAAREVQRPSDTTTAPNVSVNVNEAPGPSTKAEEMLASLKPWGLDDLHQIIATVHEYKTMARWAMAMDVMSKHPGPDGYLSTAQVAAESGMTINEWRDAPRKLPQHLKAHFPANIEWPLRAVGGRTLGRDDQVYWGITIEQASRWLRARAEAASSEPR